MSKYPDLTAELLKRGYKDDDVKKILGLNVLRVMRQAEKVAGSLQKTPSLPRDHCKLEGRGESRVYSPTLRGVIKALRAS